MYSSHTKVFGGRHAKRSNGVTSPNVQSQSTALRSADCAKSLGSSNSNSGLSDFPVYLVEIELTLSCVCACTQARPRVCTYVRGHLCIHMLLRLLDGQDGFMFFACSLAPQAIVTWGLTRMLPPGYPMIACAKSARLIRLQMPKLGGPVDRRHPRC